MESLQRYCSIKGSRHDCFSTVGMSFEPAHTKPSSNQAQAALSGTCAEAWKIRGAADLVRAACTCTQQQISDMSHMNAEFDQEEQAKANLFRQFAHNRNHEFGLLHLCARI